MIEPIEKVICKDIHEFVKEHVDEVENKLTIWGNKQTYKELGFNNRADMLKQIKNDIEVAVWALQELMVWGMSPNHNHDSHDYTKELFTEDISEEDNLTIYKVGNPLRYFATEYNRKTQTTTIIEVKRVTKLVEVTTWENVN
jgi:hypothetical protein